MAGPESDSSSGAYDLPVRVSHRNTIVFSLITAARLSCASKTTFTPEDPAATRCSCNFLPVMVSQEYAVSRLTITSVLPLGLRAAAPGSAANPLGHFQKVVCRREGTS